MSAINYTVLSLDLATARSAPGEAVLPPGVLYDSVTVLQLPAGASVDIAFGENKPGIPLLAQGQCFAFRDACNNPYSVSEALRIANVAGAGILKLLVSLATPGSVSVQ